MMETRRKRNKDRTVKLDAFKVGQKVSARWKDNFYYPAIIKDISNDNIMVKFCDDKILHTVKSQMIKQLSKESSPGKASTQPVRKRQFKNAPKKQVKKHKLEENCHKNASDIGTQDKTICENISEKLTQSSSNNALCSPQDVPTTRAEKAAIYDFDGYSESILSSESEYNPSESISDSDSDGNNIISSTQPVRKRQFKNVPKKQIKKHKLEENCHKNASDIEMQDKTMYENISERLTQSTSNNALCSPQDVPTTSAEKATIYDSDGYSESICSSESEYNPSESISDSDSDGNNFGMKLPQKNKKNVEENCKKNEGTITVVGTNNKNGDRKFDKKYNCLFCNESYSKLPRHLESQHADETEVKQLIALKNIPSERKNRKNILTKLRNIGSHAHNLRVLQKGQGNLLVVYRPSNDAEDAKNFSPCPWCYGYYVTREMWKHKCPLNDDKKKYQRILQASKQLIPLPTHASENIRSIISSMRKDNITLTAKNDKIICEFIRVMYNSKGGIEYHKQSEIRNNAREVARLLIQYRKVSGEENYTMEDMINPTNYSGILDAVKKVAGYNEQEQTFSAPELARKFGLHIKTCARVLQKIALQKNDCQLLERSEKFLKLHELQYYTEIGAISQRNRNYSKLNKDVDIPLSNDVIKLNEHLTSLSEKCMKDLNEVRDGNDIPVKSWSTLQKATLVQIIVFNRRREGEVSRMKVSDFLQRKPPQDESDFMESLTPTEKALCRLLTRVEIKGKCDRNVPILLTTHMVEKINILLEWRKRVGVIEENKFLFASCCYGAQYHYRGSKCLRTFSQECGAANPNALQSTKLRKHVASLSQVLNLRENELDILAKFMGHDIRVHREYYRLPDKVLQVAKLSKLFLCLGEGTLHQNSGKSLEEIKISESRNLKNDAKGTISLPNIKSYVEDTEDYDGPLESAQEWTSDSAREASNKNENINGHRQRRIWTEQEKIAVEKHFMSSILRGKLPGAGAIKQCLAKEPVLSNRNWRNVKDFCRNRITSLEKQNATYGKIHEMNNGM